jgi:hypothetical protein
LLSHLSRHNNHPDLARAAVREVCSDLLPAIADQDSGSGWLTV